MQSIASPSLAALAAMFTIQDALLIAYFAILSALVFWIAGAHAIHAERGCTFAIATVAFACWLARSPLHVPRALRSIVYRLAIPTMLVYSYLILRIIIPLVRPDALDEALYRLDLLLFGVEPSIWLERFATPRVVEWFSFFYFGYFAVLLTYVLLVLWVGRLGRSTAEFAIGSLGVYCIGQLGYLVVPAMGPYHYLAGSFRAPVEGGFFWHCVEQTVHAGGAMKDVFPSLHTAAPAWFTLYAFHRANEDRRWRWVGIVTGFFAVNIIISTMLLRWHYAVDVVAGLALALAVRALTPRIAKAEEDWREGMGFEPVWALSGAARARPSESKP